MVSSTSRPNSSRCSSVMVVRKYWISTSRLRTKTTWATSEMPVIQRVADQLGIQHQQSLRFFRIPTGGGLPLQQAAGTVQVSDRVNVGNEVITLRQRPCELDLQVLPGLADPDAVVLSEALEQLDALLQHAVPRRAIRILELAVLVGGPFAKQHRSGVVSSEVGGQGLLEGTTEQHRCPGVFLFPAVQVAIPVAARAAEVLADLGVAVGHQATSDPVFFKQEAEDSSAHWLAGAKPSKLSREVPLTVVWLILTTPRSPESAFSSTSSRPSKSGS